jgi:hypothetical protein
MKAKAIIASLVVAIFVFSIASTVAQPPPEGYPSGPDDFGQNYPTDPNYPGQDYPGQNYPGYPGPQSDTVPSSGQNVNDGEHPSVGPSSSQPLSTPSGSNTEALSYAEGQSLSQQEISASGGFGGGESGTKAYMMMVTGLQVWTRYNGAWTLDPASVFFWRSTSILSYNDQAQTVWSWEKYPNGQQIWRNLGYRMSGYFHGRFTGDARGWHELAMWGSRSGWSNVVWIYVW